MRRTSRNNAVCFESLEEALEKRSETYRHLDLLCFGFPCQDISGANPKGKGLKGKRSSIFFECMRIADIFNPAWLLIENVPRLLSINRGRDFATVLQTLSESGYGYSWRILDSQYFGVAQRRKRLFIVGCFGRECPPEILFERESSGRDDSPVEKVGERGFCIPTREGERQDPTAETFIASTVRGQDCPQVGNKSAVQHNIVAATIRVCPRGNTSFVWQDTYIAEVDTDREGSVTGIAKGLDTRRGVLIGNAVTVPVAEWITRRIADHDPPD